MLATIPTIDDKNLEMLLDKLNAEYDPIRIKVKPSIDSKSLDCTENVARQVKKSGGKSIFGWRIWKSKNLIEAEFHSIWENNKGELIDITPLQPGLKFTHILFVEDEALIYEGKQIDNVRLNITQNELVDLFIDSCEAIYKIKNRGERAFLHDKDFEQSLTEADIDEIVEYSKIQSALYQYTEMGKDHNDLCFCESGKEIMKCHGKDFKSKIDAILNA